MSKESSSFLITKMNIRKSEPFWATVGGELKAGESYLEAAQREFYEEIGLKKKIGKLLKENEDIFSVARSVPAKCLAKYYLVGCSSNCEIHCCKMDR